MVGSRGERERERESKPGALLLLGSEGGVSRFLQFTLYWLIQGIRTGIRVQEGRSGVIEAVSYLGFPELSERGILMGGGSLIPYLVVLLVAMSYSGDTFIQDGFLLKWMPQQSKAYCQAFTLQSFIVLCFTFKPMIHFELIFVKGVRSVSKFIFFCIWMSNGPSTIC